MCSAFGCGNVVYETVAVLIICIVMLHRHFYINIALLAFTVNDLRVKYILVFIQILYIFLDTALIMEGFFLLETFSCIYQSDLKTFGKESHFTKPLF